ncbi:laminin subunit gamma-1-like [Diaphorina citri]|uniref:Laminin subunit gamma-1-like n=1 Tax=Diaphorina citri TaxID=121845 RepID=A0A3Q0IRN6_DIACI|nr:laminin subunit gamma-1-like [Diaphorina citri]
MDEFKIRNNSERGSREDILAFGKLDFEQSSLRNQPHIMQGEYLQLFGENFVRFRNVNTKCRVLVHLRSYLESQVALDQGLTNQAKNKIGQAKTSATEASKQVQKALEEVNKIVEELNDLADIDEETLNDLEERLRGAENEFYNANLDTQLETLTQARIQQVREK